MPITEPDKADTDVRREMQLAAYKHDLTKAVKVEDLAKFYLDAGADPKYIAYRFGVALERCQRYAAALTKQREKQREREQSARGNREAPEIRQEPDAARGPDEVSVPPSRRQGMGIETAGSADCEAHG